MIKHVVPLRWRRVNEVKAESRRRLVGAKHLYKRLRTGLEGERREDLSQGWQRPGKDRKLHDPQNPLEEVPRTVHPATDMSNPDDYRVEGIPAATSSILSKSYLDL